MGVDLKQRLVNGFAARMGRADTEGGLPLDILIASQLTGSLMFWKAVVRSVIFGAVAYILLLAHPPRDFSPLLLAFILCGLSFLTITRWVAQFALAILLVVVIVPPGYLVGLFAR